MADYRLTNFGVLRRKDGAFIPSDLTNSDWQAYLLWRDGGILHTLNGDKVVLPSGPPDPQFTADDLTQQAVDQALADNLAATKADNLIAFFAKQSPANVDAYFTANVTTLPQALGVLKALTKICCVLAGRL